MRRIVVALVVTAIGLGLTACQPFDEMVAVDVGSQQTCMVRTDANMWCVGYGPKLDGQGGPAASDGPVRALELADVAAPVLGTDHSCAVLRDGTMRCWGQNQVFGQLGDGTTTGRTSPAVVTGLSGVKALDAGGARTCATTTTGQAWCWGDNDFGGIGDGTQVGRPVPTAVLRDR